MVRRGEHSIRVAPESGKGFISAKWKKGGSRRSNVSKSLNAEYFLIPHYRLTTQVGRGASRWVQRLSRNRHFWTGRLRSFEATESIFDMERWKFNVRKSWGSRRRLCHYFFTTSRLPDIEHSSAVNQQIILGIKGTAMPSNRSTVIHAISVSSQKSITTWYHQTGQAKKLSGYSIASLWKWQCVLRVVAFIRLCGSNGSFDWSACRNRTRPNEHWQRGCHVSDCGHRFGPPFSMVVHSVQCWTAGPCVFVAAGLQEGCCCRVSFC